MSSRRCWDDFQSGAGRNGRRRPGMKMIPTGRAVDSAVRPESFLDSIDQCEDHVE